MRIFVVARDWCWRRRGGVGRDKKKIARGSNTTFVFTHAHAFDPIHAVSNNGDFSAIANAQLRHHEAMLCAIAKFRARVMRTRLALAFIFFTFTPSVYSAKRFVRIALIFVAVSCASGSVI